MDLVLTRTVYAAFYTLGFLFADDLKLATVERPWIPNTEGPGGMPKLSCIPEGEYLVRPHHSVKFPDSYILTGQENGVYRYPGDIPEGQKWGRSAILIHVGNSAADVIGCIAVGQKHSGERVAFSRAAMDQLRFKLGSDEHQLSIVAA